MFWCDRGCSSVIIWTLRLWLHKSRGTGAWSWVISGYNCWCRYHNMETLAPAPARVWYLTSEIHNFKILTADFGFTQPKYFTMLLLQAKNLFPVCKKYFPGRYWRKMCRWWDFWIISRSLSILSSSSAAAPRLLSQWSWPGTLNQEYQDQTCKPGLMIVPYM